MKAKIEVNEEGPRHDPSDNVNSVPLHKAEEESRRYDREAIRKPPPTANVDSGRASKDDNNNNSSSTSSSGGEANGSYRHYTKSHSNSSSSVSNTESNSGASSGRHVITATGNSNSSSGDDRASSDKGSSSNTFQEEASKENRSLPYYYNRGDHGKEHDLTKAVQRFNRVEGDAKFSQNGHGQTESPRPQDSQKSTIEKETIGTIQESDDSCHIQKNVIKYNDQQNPKKSPSDNGSDGGYAGSASSNDVFENTSSTSDSVSSTEGHHAPKSTALNGKRCRKEGKDPTRYASSSSEIADFSSGEGASDSGEQKINGKNEFSNSSQRFSSSSYLLEDSSSDDSDGNSKNRADKKRNRDPNENIQSHDNIKQTGSTVAKRRKMPAKEDFDHYSTSSQQSVKLGTKTTGLPPEQDEINVKYDLPSSWDYIDRTLQSKMLNLKDLRKNYQSAMDRLNRDVDSDSSMSSSKSFQKSSIRKSQKQQLSRTTPLYNVGVDIMAKILSYLEPIEANRVLSEPLSKTFRETFSVPQDVWKILCLSEPFYAMVDKKRSDSDDSISSFPVLNNNVEVRHVLGRYRLLYSSFVRCLSYLDRIKDDALHGRTRMYNDPEHEFDKSQFQRNSSLVRFFARARDVTRRESDSDISSSSLSSEGKDNTQEQQESDGSKKTKAKRPKYAHSKLTRSLLGPVHQSGIAGSVDLPRSCAVYSIVNWMVAFADVAGIQMMCMHVLPILLEDEQQRTTAQNAGLTDIVLRAMVLFPSNADLHTSAFHTLVLLARPIGGKEGMIFYRAMVNASGIFNIGSSTGKSGIAIMLDSMKRFSNNEKLQAMSCWSMVNIALIQSQKVALVRLGGISAAGNAMMQHPTSPEVQFRALFALINLVIPSENLPENSLEAAAIREQVDGVSQNSEIDMLDESVEYITNLVVDAMKNFCSNAAILNRALLVLHNLSLNDKYHNVLLWTPNCYQMIEWCIENYKQDKVLQSSARGTLQRLQEKLSNDESLQLKFRESIRAQHESMVDSVTLENAGNSERDQQNEGDV